jgi:hypothetical protein
MFLRLSLQCYHSTFRAAFNRILANWASSTAMLNALAAGVAAVDLSTGLHSRGFDAYSPGSTATAATDAAAGETHVGATGRPLH